MYLFS